MKNKDRVIRRTNIPDREIIYTVYKGSHRKVYALLGIIIIVMLFNINLLNGFIGIGVFIIVLLTQRKIIDIEICDNCIIKYLDTDFAEVIYFDEVINYQINTEEHRHTVTFLLKDGDEYEHTYYDRNITHTLQQVIGDKNATR